MATQRSEPGHLGSSPNMFVAQESNASRPRLAVKKEPTVKREPVDDARAGLDSDEEPMNAEAEGLLAEHEGVEYYEDEGFKIKQVPRAVVVNRYISELYELSRTKYLKLDPEYQRDVVWDETRASGLIASIFQGYFIPPVIFNVIPERERDHNGVEKLVNYRICVDGKQRLTSVKKFVEGEIGVLDSCSPPKKWYYSHPIVNGEEKISNHNILPEATKTFFRQRVFCCYEYEDLQESVEENMFQLVQRGMPLTPAERMRALSTRWATFAKQYEADYPKIVNLSKQSRASGFRAVVTIFCQILEVMHPSGNKRTNREGVGSKPILQASPQTLTRLLLDNHSLTEGVKAKLKEVFDKFQELVDACTETSSKNKLGFRVIPNSAFDPAPDFLSERGVGHVKTFSPLELMATAILLLVHMGSRTANMLIGDVKEMRHYLRENHKDLRLNNLCWGTAWDFIDVVLIQRRGGRGAVRKRRGIGSEPSPDEEYEVVEEEEEEGADDIVGPDIRTSVTTSRQRTIAAQRGAPAGSSSGVGPSVSPSAPPAPPRYFASATPRGALADPNAPAFKAFENPNPLAAPRIVTPTESSGSSAPSPLKRTLELDLGQPPGMSRTKITRR